MRILFALLIAATLAACSTAAPESVSSHPGKIGGEQAAKQNNMVPVE